MCPDHQVLHKQWSEKAVMVAETVLLFLSSLLAVSRANHVQTMEFLLPPIDQNPFVNVILVLQLNLFFPVELRVSCKAGFSCSIRFVLLPDLCWLGGNSK